MTANNGGGIWHLRRLLHIGETEVVWLSLFARKFLNSQLLPAEISCLSLPWFYARFYVSFMLLRSKLRCSEIYSKLLRKAGGNLRGREVGAISLGHPPFPCLSGSHTREKIGLSVMSHGPTIHQVFSSLSTRGEFHQFQFVPTKQRECQSERLRDSRAIGQHILVSRLVSLSTLWGFI